MSKLTFLKFKIEVFKVKNLIPKTSILASKIVKLDLIFSFLESNFSLLESNIGTFGTRFKLLKDDIDTFGTKF